jgi:hypothetical protein
VREQSGLRSDRKRLGPGAAFRAGGWRYGGDGDPLSRGRQVMAWRRRGERRGLVALFGWKGRIWLFRRLHTRDTQGAGKKGSVWVDTCPMQHIVRLCFSHANCLWTVAPWGPTTSGPVTRKLSAADRPVYLGVAFHNSGGCALGSSVVAWQVAGGKAWGAAVARATGDGRRVYRARRHAQRNAPATTSTRPPSAAMFRRIP